MSTDVNLDLLKDSEKIVSVSDNISSDNASLDTEKNKSTILTAFKKEDLKNLIDQIRSLKEGLNAKYITSVQFSEAFAKLNNEKGKLEDLSKKEDIINLINQINSLKDGFSSKFITSAQFLGAFTKLENDKSKLLEFTNKIDDIQKGLINTDISIASIMNKIDDIPSTKGYSQLFFIIPPFLLLFALLVVGFFVKPPSMDSINDRIEKLSINITENSDMQMLKLKGNTNEIKSIAEDLNKKSVAEIKDLIAKIGNTATLSNDIIALKTTVDKLLANPLNKKDLDDIKLALKTLVENKSTTSLPQFIGQPTEASKFAKELSVELLKSKGFTDEIVKSTNQATKEALKLVDDKIKFIADSIKISPKNDKIEDSLKSIDGNFKSILDSINKNSKTDKATDDKFIKLTSEIETLKKVKVISKNQPFLIICSTTPTFNPIDLVVLNPLFKDLRKTIRENYRNIDLKIGLEYSSNFIRWFDNDNDIDLSVKIFAQAQPVFSSNFLNNIILDIELKNNILSDVIIIVPPGTGGGLKTNGGTPIFMNGVRVHVIYLALPNEKNTITDSMLGWSKFAATNGGGTFTVLTIKAVAGGKPDEDDLVKKVNDHVLKLVQKFSY